jgi:hypothetical protein
MTSSLGNSYTEEVRNSVTADHHGVRPNGKAVQADIVGRMYADAYNKAMTNHRDMRSLTVGPTNSGHLQDNGFDCSVIIYEIVIKEFHDEHHPRTLTHPQSYKAFVAIDYKGLFVARNPDKPLSGRLPEQYDGEAFYQDLAARSGHF